MKKPASRLKLKHRYRVVFQGLFVGVEWSIFEDGHKICSGEAFNMSEAFRDARAAYHGWVGHSSNRYSRTSRPRGWSAAITHGIPFDFF